MVGGPDNGPFSFDLDNETYAALRGRWVVDNVFKYFDKFHWTQSNILTEHMCNEQI